MRYTTIKSVDGEIKLSKIALGAGVYGFHLPKETAFELMDCYVACGGNTIDTARLYGTKFEGIDGKICSERVVGQWLKTRKDRENLVIMTKGASPIGGDYTVSRLSPEELRADFYESLKVLDIDCIDVYFLHRDDESVPVESVIDTIDEFVKQGKMRAFGVSNWRMERILTANEYARKTGKIEITVSQIQWSYAHSSEEVAKKTRLVCMNETEYELYKEHKIPVIAYSSQAKGFMVYADKFGMDNLKKSVQSYICEENVEKLATIQKISKETGKSITELSIGYITSDTDVDGIALIGASSVEQLKENLSYADVFLDENIEKQLYGF